jgi:hypothetical protein
MACEALATCAPTHGSTAKPAVATSSLRLSMPCLLKKLFDMTRSPCLLCVVRGDHGQPDAERPIYIIDGASNKKTMASPDVFLFAGVILTKWYKSCG